MGAAPGTPAGDGIDVTRRIRIWYDPAMRATHCLIACVFVAAAGLSGCGSTSNVESRSTTVGQELQDLEEARNKGLLTEDDYQRQRETILDRK